MIILKILITLAILLLFIAFSIGLTIWCIGGLSDIDDDWWKTK